MRSGGDLKYLKHKSHFSDKSGEQIQVMRYDGLSFGRVYYYFDDKKRGYLDSLSVSKKIRNCGEGTRIQKLRESILKRRGFKYSMLWVDKNSWMFDWYKRRGYKYSSKKNKNFVWMKKKL